MRVPIHTEDNNPAEHGFVQVREIMGPEQEEACFWLQLLQGQFPLSEQVPAGSILRLFQAKGRGEAPNSHFLTAHHPDTGESLGMAWVQIDPTIEAAALWYLAVAPSKEGQGYGSDLLAQICRRTFVAERCRLLVMEVEMAEDGHEHHASQAQARLRQIAQRNRFYMERHHALHLQGIHYTQQVGDQDAIPMDLLVLFDPALPPLSPEETFTRLKKIWGDSLQQKGPLQLSSQLPTPVPFSPTQMETFP